MLLELSLKHCVYKVCAGSTKKHKRCIQNIWVRKTKTYKLFLHRKYVYLDSNTKQNNICCFCTNKIKLIKCDLCENKISQSSDLNKHKLLKKKDYNVTCVNKDSHNPVLSKFLYKQK